MDISLRWWFYISMSAYVYILTNKRNGTLYIGCTTDLIRRVYEHKIEAVEGFTKKHKLKQLVYFEEYEALEGALNREKQMKEWKRQWKVELIEKNNPIWTDLYVSISS